MTSTFEFFSGVREKVRAWEECTDCNGEGKILRKHGPSDMIMCYHKEFCISCNGEGGKWNSLIKDDPSLGLMFNTKGKLWFPFRGDKSSILIRTHKICGACYVSLNHNVAVQVDSTKRCDHCLKDSNGNPTGCEPGTASEWEVLR